MSIELRAAARRLLLVSFHYGPQAATGGFRWTRLVPLLVERGWSFDVLTHDPVDPRANEGPVRAHQIAVPRAVERLAWLPGELPGALLRTVRRSRGTPSPTTPAIDATPMTRVDPSRVLLPRLGESPPIARQIIRSLDGLAHETRMIGWARAVARFGISLAQQHEYAAVVVSTPPHATLHAGERIASATGLPFIPDMRDPWVLGIGESSRNADSVHRSLGVWMEPRLHAAAACVVHNTDIERRVIEEQSPGSARARRTISNGHDLKVAPGCPSRERFILTYTGHLHPWMDPRPFFAACQRALASRPAVRAVTEIHFMGTNRQFGGVDLVGLAAAYDLGDLFHFRERGTREAANALQESAAILLAYDCTHPLCIPAKFFDYAYMRGAMLLLGHPAGAMAEVAKPLGVRVLAPQDSAGIDAALVGVIGRWQRDDLKRQNDAEGIYARPRQADAWDALLREFGARQ